MKLSLSYSWIFTIGILSLLIVYMLVYYFDIFTYPTHKINRLTKTIGDPGIVSLKTAEFYDSLTPKNKALRVTCSPKYRLPTEAETSRLNPSFQQAMYLLSWKTPYLSGEEPQWIIAEKDTEAGMPHTLSRYIILPEGCWESSSKEELVHLFVHELCHIHQRQHPREWNSLYQSCGFESYSSWIILPNQRMNPDTIQHGMWSYDGLIPVEIFNKDAMSIKDTTLHWKPVSTNSIHKIMNDSQEEINIHKLEKDFPYITQLEHPNEIYACMIAEFFVPLNESSNHNHLTLIQKNLFQE
jgi:hypothetical protein